MLKTIFRWIGRLLGLLLLLLFLAYWLVPPATERLFDVETIRQKLHTVIIPSDQPKTVSLPSREKKILRATHLDTYIGVAAQTLIGLPKLIYHYTTLTPEFTPLSDRSIGLFIDPAKNDKAEILDALSALPIRSVGLRIYVTADFVGSDAYQRHLEMARTLHARGYELLLVLAQLRESFDENLEKRLRRIIRDFGPSVDFYQIGEAINRTKWGARNRHHYQRFVAAAVDAVRQIDPDAKTLGPGVIDFEWFYTLYYDALVGDAFDISAALLYVDRVREPENTQYGFDTAAKMRLLKAITPDKPLWITEVNWPIRDMGGYMPTSNSSGVSEAAYRNYMLRYLLIALGSGYTERVYWWQLFARGYGLADHLDLRRRSAFDAFGMLSKLLAGSTPRGGGSEGSLYHYRFEKNGHLLHFFWTKDGQSAALPAALACRRLDGTVLPHPQAGPTPIVCTEEYR